MKRKRNNQQYSRESYKNLSEDEKQKFVEYRKKYCRMRKCLIIIIRMHFNLENFTSL